MVNDGVITDSQIIHALIAPGNKDSLTPTHPHPTQTPPSLPSCLCLSTPFHTNTHSLPFPLHSHTHSHFSQYGSALGSGGASSDGQSSQVWTEEEQVYCCQQRLINTLPAIWDGLHVYVIILKTLCQQTLLRPYNLPPMRKVFSPHKGSLCGSAHRCAAQPVLICNKLVIQSATRCKAAPWGQSFEFKMFLYMLSEEGIAVLLPLFINLAPWTNMYTTVTCLPLCMLLF